MTKSDEPSALSKIVETGAKGAASPSPAAQIAGEILAPPGAGEALAQGLQMGANAAIKGSKGFMEATVRQHGRSPSAVLNDLQIQKTIATKGQNNKGIEALRQKASANQTAQKTGQSTNQGIKSYQSKAGGQSTDSSKSSVSGGKSGGSSNENSQGR